MAKNEDTQAPKVVNAPFVDNRPHEEINAEKDVGDSGDRGSSRKDSPEDYGPLHGDGAADAQDAAKAGSKKAPVKSKAELKKEE